MLGLLVGSFLNVVIWRVPRGESIVSPPSACPKCGARIRARENIPVVSWLLLRGRCRSCRASISARYPLVELGTGLLFAAVGWWAGLSAELPAFLYLAGISVALTFIDLDTHRLPDAIVLPAYPVGLVLLSLASWANDDWWALARGGIGAAALFALYFVLMVVRPGGMGFGDVKLAGVLGLYLAWVGWAALVVGAFAAFLVGGVLSIVLLLSGRATRKSGIPFGPFMLLGAWIGIAAGEPLAAAYLSLLN
ncbi:prepilin peptidase [Cellulomonas humilata]|uniref:prepilin peptidase n=1 Tax=Cellulomonas humilata TaxID=144055 RepID=UPI0031B6298B